MLFNPRLTKRFFCNTSNQGGLLQPPMNLKNKHLRYGHGIAIGLLFPYIPKKYKHPMYDVKMTLQLPIFSKLPIYSEIQAKIKFLTKEFQIQEFHLFFFFFFFFFALGNVVSNIYCKIQDHVMKMFFKLVISKTTGLHPPPHPLTLKAYPTSG